MASTFKIIGVIVQTWNFCVQKGSYVGLQADNEEVKLQVSGNKGADHQPVLYWPYSHDKQENEAWMWELCPTDGKLGLKNLEFDESQMLTTQLPPEACASQIVSNDTGKEQEQKATLKISYQETQK